MSRRSTRTVSGAKQVRCRDCNELYDGNKPAHRGLCTKRPAGGTDGLTGAEEEEKKRVEEEAAVEREREKAKAVEAACFVGAATCLVTADDSLALPMAVPAWVALFTATKPIWDKVNEDVVEEKRVSSDKQPSEAIWASALYVARRALPKSSVPPRSESGESAAKRPQFMSQGAVTEANVATIWVPKPASGFLETYIGVGGVQDAIRFHYLPTTPPVCDHMLACQHASVDDVAVFNYPDAMTAFTGMLTAEAFGDSLEDVRRVLTTGRVKDVMVFCKMKSLRTQLAGLQDAVTTLAHLFRDYYGMSCTLVEPLQNLMTERILSKEYAAAAALAKEAGYSEADAQLSASTYLIELVNKTLLLWQDRAMVQLTKHFMKPNLVTDVDSGLVFRRVGAMPDFIAPVFTTLWSEVKADLSKVTPRAKLPQNDRGKGTGGSGGVSVPNTKKHGNGDRGNGAMPAWVELKASEVVARGLPRELATLQAMGYNEAVKSNERRWLFKLKLDGESVCLKNFFNGHGHGGCSANPCAGKEPRAHVYKTAEAFEKRAVSAAGRS